MKLWPDAVQMFLADPACNLTTEQSRKGYAKALQGLHFHYPNHELEDYTEQDLLAFCGRPDLAPNSRKGYRTRVHAFFSWAKWRGLIKEDPSSNLQRALRPGTEPVSTFHWLSEEEVNKVLDSIDTSTLTGLRTLVVLRLGFTSGLRRNEIASLKWDDVSLPKQQITLLGKGQKKASVFITDRTAAVLEKWHAAFAEGLGRDPKNEPVVCRFRRLADFQGTFYTEPIWEDGLSPDAVARIVERASKEVGIDFKAHDMRRSFAGILEDRGVPIQDISAALRHSNIGTTQRYLEKRQDAAYRAVRARGFDL